MALFGEKYGDEVRMIEVEGVSRELCGGTHVQQHVRDRGLQDRLREGSSAANVRRIEAVTGPEAVRAAARARRCARARSPRACARGPRTRSRAVESQLERAERARARAEVGRRGPACRSWRRSWRRRPPRSAGVRVRDRRMRGVRRPRSCSSWPTG